MCRMPHLNFILLLAIVGFVADATAQAIPGRTLLWADEFTQADGTQPDSAKWGYDIGGSGWGNNELQHYTNRTENARIEGGQLVIEARKENFEERAYTSARLLTRDKVSWTYGRIEARIKVARGQGIWPAFWMLGSNIGSAGWPFCGEIDIMENIGREPSILHGTVHGPGYSGEFGISGDYVLNGAALADDFHVYAIEWEENRIRWFIDGQQYFSLTPDNLPGGSAWVFNQPQFLILNVAVGGNWPGYPDGTTTFPQRMTVDYVRVYSPIQGNPTNTVVTVDPAEPWLGYMHVSNLPANGGAYQFGQSWETANLNAMFNGPVLTLSPNTIGDPASYWYAGGGAPGSPGNKIMAASMYVERSGSLAGKTVVFSGNVLTNTLTSAHSTVAFIKDFAPDYSSSSTITAPLVNGSFNLSLATNAGAGRHVQYGFETVGVNVWATDASPFGSIRITADPYATWIAGFDTSDFTAPDLSPAGDPDGDGLTNGLEFALDGDPTVGTASAKVRAKTETVAGETAMLLTLPVLNGATFSGATTKSATVGNVVYTIEGSNNLTHYNQSVTEVSPARSENLPAPNSGWTYRSFRLDGAIGGGNPRGPSGFLRARVAVAP